MQKSSIHILTNCICVSYNNENIFILEIDSVNVQVEYIDLVVASVSKIFK